MEPEFVLAASLIGDSSRAVMLRALMGGRVLRAGELAREAGITLQSASSHLAKLQHVQLVCLRKHGRYKYVTLTGDHVVQVLELLTELARSDVQLRNRFDPTNTALRYSRVCCNHLAGEIGTQLFDSMVGRQFLSLSDGVIGLTAGGSFFLGNFWDRH
ncbi:MAG: ArsR/SmtB family transcription factor [Rhizomicrobium sp.]